MNNAVYNKRMKYLRNGINAKLVSNKVDIQARIHKKS